MSRGRSAALGLFLIAISRLYVSAAQVPLGLAAPPGYRETDQSEVAERETHELPTGPLDRETVTGRSWITNYDALPALRRRPLDVLRHYVSLAEARGGLRLGGYVTDEGGSTVVFVPAPRPLWAHIVVEAEGEGVEVRFVEETTPRARRFSVPSDRLPGQWNADQPDLSAYPTTLRPAVGAHFSQVSAMWRAADPLRQPKGGAFSVAMPSIESVPETGPVPVVTTLLVRPRSQACESCPQNPDGEARRLVAITINEPEVAAKALELKDAQGHVIYEWRPAARPNATTTRTRDRHVVLTREGRPALWLPVSRAAYLQAQIAAVDGMGRDVPDAAKIRAEQEAAIRDLEKIDPAAAKAARAAIAATPIPDMRAVTGVQRAELTEALAALSEKERAEPARLEDGTEIVIRNPAFFDAAAPRVVPQVVVVTYAEAQDYALADLVDRLMSVDWRPLLAGRPERSPR
jgi:hypothetical protein